jgi:hypothetical protein
MSWQRAARSWQKSVDRRETTEIGPLRSDDSMRLCGTETSTDIYSTTKA